LDGKDEGKNGSWGWEAFQITRLKKCCQLLVKIFGRLNLTGKMVEHHILSSIIHFLTLGHGMEENNISFIEITSFQTKGAFEKPFRYFLWFNNMSTADISDFAQHGIN
jgi:hypothetical protein